VHRVLEGLSKRDQLYLHKHQIMNTDNIDIKGGRNMNSSVKLKPLDETYKLLLSDPSLHSLSPRQIAPSFHQKSHFKALTSVYMMQGHGAKIIDTEK